jgi:hypothetical protein
LVRRVAPDQRLDRIEFSPQAELLERAIHLGAYSCPHCGQKVEFSTRHFREHEFSRRSNLATAWQELFDAERPLDRSRWESFFDFHCPGCQAPVRIIYEPGAEFAMGAHPWRIIEVLESAEGASGSTKSRLTSSIWTPPTS